MDFEILRQQGLAHQDDMKQQQEQSVRGKEQKRLDWIEGVKKRVREFEAFAEERGLDELTDKAAAALGLTIAKFVDTENGNYIRYVFNYPYKKQETEIDRVPAYFKLEIDRQTLDRNIQLFLHFETRYDEQSKNLPNTITISSAMLTDDEQMRDAFLTAFKSPFPPRIHYYQPSDN